jgi:C-terminal region of MMR_HSR1 domain
MHVVTDLRRSRRCRETVSQPASLLVNARTRMLRTNVRARPQMRGDHDVDDLVDVIEGNRIYIPCLYVLNKIDQITLEELEVIDRMENYVPICAYHEWNLDGVLEAVWDRLDLIRCGPRCAAAAAAAAAARARGAAGLCVCRCPCHVGAGLECTQRVMYSSDRLSGTSAYWQQATKALLGAVRRS